jgi:hypothetical protein
MSSASGDIHHKGQIYYQFKNEKRKNVLVIDNSGDDKLLTVYEVKQKISSELKQKQNGSKLDFDLLLFGENSNLCLSESEKISEGQTITIERVPWYKLGNGSENENYTLNYKEIRNKERKFDYNLIEKLLCSVNDTDKILRVLNENIIKSYTCRFCGLFQEDYEFLMTRCCGESGCKKCLDDLCDKLNNNLTLGIKGKKINGEYEEIYTIESQAENKMACPVCNVDISCFEKYVMPNKKFNELRGFFNELSSVKSKKTSLKLNIEEANINNGLQVDKIIAKSDNQQDVSTSNNTPTSLMKLTPSNYVNAAINLFYNPNSSNSNKKNNYSNSTNISTNYPSSNDQIIYSLSNPHFPFFENSRFFIIKSYCKENIEISQLHNEWATTVTNQKKLNEAFKEKNVVLIFSANKSGIFQGYALMKNFIGDKTSDIWNLENCVKIGGNFKVQWLCSCEYPFSKLKHLNNPFNNHEPLIKSRDTQEITKELGIQVCHLLYDQEKQKIGTKPILDNNIIPVVLSEVKKNREKGNYEFISKTSANNFGNQEVANKSYISNSRKNSYEDRSSKIKNLIF